MVELCEINDANFHRVNKLRSLLMATTSDIRNGMIIRFKGGLYEFIEFLHVKPGKGAAFVRSKLKNLETGKVVDNTFRTSEKLDEVRVEKHKKEYLYHDGSFYVFMDINTYEQMSVDPVLLKGKENLLIENMVVTMKIDEDGNIIGVELPITVIQEIAECEPNVKGNSALKILWTRSGPLLCILIFP